MPRRTKKERNTRMKMPRNIKKRKPKRRDPKRRRNINYLLYNFDSHFVTLKLILFIYDNLSFITPISYLYYIY